MEQALSDILPILLLVFSLLLFGIAMYNFSQRKMASELLPTSYVAPVETNKLKQSKIINQQSKQI